MTTKTTVHPDSHWTCQDDPSDCYELDRYGADLCVSRKSTKFNQSCCWFVKDDQGKCSRIKPEGFSPDKRSPWQCQDKPTTCGEFTRYDRDACVATQQKDGQQCCFYSKGTTKQCSLALRGGAVSDWVLDPASNWTCMPPPKNCDDWDKYGKDACIGTKRVDGTQCCFYTDSAGGTPKNMCRAKIQSPASTVTVDPDSDYTCQGPPADCRELDRYTNSAEACIRTSRNGGLPCCYYYNPTQGGRCRNNGTLLADFTVDANSPWQCQPAPQDCTAFQRYGKTACTAVKSKANQQCCWYTSGAQTMCGASGTKLPGFTLDQGNPSTCS
jgi:hypothetical protein